MKVAVPTRNENVDDHFGHCEYYTIYTIENSIIKNKENYKAPEGCGCKSNVASVLSEMGVSIMLAGNMGAGALAVLENNGISVFRGCSGKVDEVVDLFLKGFVKDSGVGCHNHDHECNH